MQNYKKKQCNAIRHDNYCYLCQCKTKHQDRITVFVSPHCIMDITPDNEQIRQAMQLRAEQYCAAGEHCRSEVREKLRQWGCPDGMLADVVTQLAADGFIDELRYCRQFCDAKIRLHAWGRLKISSQLRVKQIDSATIAEALDGMDTEQYNSVLLSTAQKKAKTLHDDDLAKRKAKLGNYLASHGYEIGEIKSVINHIYNTL